MREQSQGRREVTYYNDESGIRITSTRAVIRNRTFLVANITTVTTSRRPPSWARPVCTMLVGLAIAAAALVPMGIGGRLIALAVGATTFYLGCRRLVSVKDLHVLVVGNAAGEATALCSRTMR
jgi:hypothetical protein